jgi:hypothetical protein
VVGVASMACHTKSHADWLAGSKVEWVGQIIHGDLIILPFFLIHAMVQFWTVGMNLCENRHNG